MEDADTFPELAILQDLTSSSTQPSYLFALTATASSSATGKKMEPRFAQKAKTLPMVLGGSGGLSECMGETCMGTADCSSG